MSESPLELARVDALGVSLETLLTDDKLSEQKSLVLESATKLDYSMDMTQTELWWEYSE